MVEVEIFFTRKDITRGIMEDSQDRPKVCTNKPSTHFRFLLNTQGFATDSLLAIQEKS